MPTPAHIFAELAARYGDVDPDDLASVTRWYTEELPHLPREQIEEILEELLARQGSEVGSAKRGGYPDGASLPSLTDARRVPPPLLAVGLLRRLAAHLGRKREV